MRLSVWDSEWKKERRERTKIYIYIWSHKKLNDDLHTRAHLLTNGSSLFLKRKCHSILKPWESFFSHSTTNYYFLRWTRSWFVRQRKKQFSIRIRIIHIYFVSRRIHHKLNYMIISFSVLFIRFLNYFFLSFFLLNQRWKINWLSYSDVNSAKKEWIANVLVRWQQSTNRLFQMTAQNVQMFRAMFFSLFSMNIS